MPECDNPLPMCSCLRRHQERFDGEVVAIGNFRIEYREATECPSGFGETTADGKFTLVEYECLGSCGTAPAALCNEVLHEDITPESFEKALDALPDDPHHYKDPTVTWEAH